MTNTNTLGSFETQANRLNRLSARDGSSGFFHSINTSADLAWLGIHDLHDAYRWYNDHVRRVPYNSIRVIRVAQSVWPHTINTTTWKYSAVNAKTGRMKLLPKLRRSPISTGNYVKMLREFSPNSLTAFERDATRIA